MTALSVQKLFRTILMQKLYERVVKHEPKEVLEHSEEVLEHSVEVVEQDLF